MFLNGLTLSKSGLKTHCLIYTAVLIIATVEVLLFRSFVQFLHVL